MDQEASAKLGLGVDILLEETLSLDEACTYPIVGTLDGLKGAINVYGTVLFADFAGSTSLVDQFDRKFSLWVLRAYLLCTSSIIVQAGGHVAAFEGDGIMAVFTGANKESDAVRCAFKIQWAISHIIQPRIDRHFPDTGYKMSHVVGIDSSELCATKTNIWGFYDILWLGRASNYAANLTRINDTSFSTYVTLETYSKLDTDLTSIDSGINWAQIRDAVPGQLVLKTFHELPIDII